MNSITLAIEVFESKATEIRLAYIEQIKTKSSVNLSEIEERDSAIEKCLWAIETLHEAYIEQKATENSVGLSKREQIESGLLKI